LAVRELAGPFEILELADGETIFLKPVEYEFGEVIIHPRYPGAPPEKKILALRIHVDPATKPFFPYYHDLTSRRLVAGIVPVLDEAIGRGVWLRITKFGVAPRAWFEWSVEEVLPAGVAGSVPVRL